MTRRYSTLALHCIILNLSVQSYRFGSHFLARIATLSWTWFACRPAKSLWVDGQKSTSKSRWNWRMMTKEHTVYKLFEVPWYEFWYRVDCAENTSFYRDLIAWAHAPRFLAFHATGEDGSWASPVQLSCSPCHKSHQQQLCLFCFETEVYLGFNHTSFWQSRILFWALSEQNNMIQHA